MDRFQRIFQLHRILSSARYPIQRAHIQEKLECSRATFYRTVADMRDYLGAPIDRDPQTGGYHYDGAEAEFYELPGLWLTPSELHGLLVMQQMLHKLEPGLLDTELKPVQERIKTILNKERLGAGELTQRVRILGIAQRRPSEWFPVCAEALVQRIRLEICYHGRASDKTTERVISPQRLTHYRDNWYLDAWCHQVNELRTFALDRIKQAQVITAKARDIAEEQLHEHYASAYGIFSGPALNTAVLHFTAKAARWVADEEWHPRQQGRWLQNGYYELQVPYGDPRELVREILKYGADVKVIGPSLLKGMVAQALKEAAERYTKSVPVSSIETLEV